ncbi:MAG TPA: acylphosphatase [Kofleriaceae bacterium]|jgi:acylphosphatase|nr:acylphosphatase [Kofleriaceae bacterium]
MSDADRKRIRAIVRGLVQGVSFRATTRREAARLGLSGWVRNQPDGSVSLEAQGPADRVDALVAWCRKGPPAAEVASVEIEAMPAVDGEHDFAIRY